MSEGICATAQLSDIDPVGELGPGEPEWRPVRHTLGISAFGINAWVAREDGQPVIEEHTEDDEETRQEEVYFVASGHATFKVADDEVDAPAGTFVFVRDPSVVRSAIGHTKGTTVLAVGAEPGSPFKISDWEKRHIS